MGWESGSALKKGLAVVVVALVMLIPLAQLSNLITERAQLREQAIDSVARGWGGRQVVSGPILAVPVTQTNDNGREVTRDWFVMPESLSLESQIRVQGERRKLGVYEVPVYVARIHATGQFNYPHELAKLLGTGSIQAHPEHARLLLPVSDLRGLRDITPPQGFLASELEPAGGGFPIPNLVAPLQPAVDLAGGTRSFDLTIEVAGTQSLQFLPLAHSTRLKVSGNWPDPGFASGFLPVERQISNTGFTATWQVLDLNRSYGSHWLQGDVNVHDVQDSAFGVDLVQPVDLYQQIARAVKYASLFIGLSFLTLFLWEHLAQRSLHPIQYGLLGLALSVFFLLLLALAEHVGFTAAYALAAVALCLLLAIYLAGAMASPRSGMVSGGVFGVVYSLLYLLVISEDYALLAGALGLFAVLAVAMVLTRRVNWYAAPETSSL